MDLRRCVIMFGACAYCTNMMAQTATFGYFSYEGNDARFDSNTTVEPVSQSRHSRILSRPSVCRKGDTYYLVNSSSAFYPGVPIFSSKGLGPLATVGPCPDRDPNSLVSSQRFRRHFAPPSLL